MDDKAFFEAVISAGAILAGFCGTFLAFRIQREANYYRQLVVSYEEGKAKDVFVGFTHFTSSFLLIILATIAALLFGFLFPLFALASAGDTFIKPELVVAGLVAATVLLGGYFADELLHYGILHKGLENDMREWGKEVQIVIASVVLAMVSAIITYLRFS